MDIEYLIEKITAFPTKKVYDPRTDQEIQFSLEPDKIRFFFQCYLPKWRNDKRYYLISQKFWGVRQQILLYMDETGTDFFVDYYQ